MLAGLWELRLDQEHGHAERGAGDGEWGELSVAVVAAAAPGEGAVWCCEG